jgi:hypothetical protein
VQQTLTPFEFNLLFHNLTKKDIVEITDVFVDGNVEINKDTKYNCDFIIFRNVTFLGNIIFENIDLGKGLSFHSCNFKDLFLLKGAKAEGYLHRQDDIFYSLTFEGCNIPRFTLYDNFLERGIEISKDSKIDGLNIQALKISNTGINIEDSSFEKKFSFTQVVSISGPINIYNSKLNCRLKIENLHVDSISFNGVEIKKDALIWLVKCNSGITFNDGTYNDDFKMTAVNVNENLTIYGTEFKKNLLIEIEDPTNDRIGAIRAVYISDAKFGNGFILKGAYRIINALHLKSSPILSGTVLFDGCLFNKVNLSGDNHKGNIIFTSSKFGSVSFDHFSNYGNILFSSCEAISKEDSELRIGFSNLGKGQFFNFSFDSFSKVAIFDSQISEIITTGVTWFNDKQLTVESYPRQDFYIKKREVFRQLKQSSEKQGDKIQALEFQALELKAFKQSVKTKEHFFNNDRMILLLSQTNDFGLNWRKPLYWVTGITILFFILIAIDISPELKWLPARTLSDIKITFQCIFRNIFIFPQLFNPARAINRMFDGMEMEIKVSASLYFLDALHRIILAFFIVQIVSAFRKYVK